MKGAVGRLVVRRLPSDLRDAASTSALRIVLVPVAGFASLFATHLVVSTTGNRGFAIYSLLVTLPALFPISDFGFASTLTDLAATQGVNSAVFRDGFRRVRRLLVSISLVGIALSLMFGCFGLWSVVLGLGGDATTNIVASGIVILTCVGVPLGAGQRILLGLEKQFTSTAVMSLSPLISLVLVACVATAGHPSGGNMAFAYALGPLTAQVLIAVVAARAVRAARIVPDRFVVGTPPRAISYREIFAGAWPMVVLAVTLPLAYQSDRTLLSNLRGLDEVSAYSYGAVLYLPLLTAVLIGGQALWPRFMRLGQNEQGVRGLYQASSRFFTGFGVLLGLLIASLGPVVQTVIAPGTVPSRLTFVAFGVLLILMSFNVAAGMFLMFPRGRAVQALLSVTMLGVKIGLAYLLIPLFGSPGAIAATVLAAGLVMVLPVRLIASRQIARTENVDVETN